LEYHRSWLWLPRVTFAAIRVLESFSADKSTRRIWLEELNTRLFQLISPN
jgi:hypothetical protein